MKVLIVEYIVVIIIGGIGCVFFMLFLLKIIDNNSKGFMYGVIFSGFILYIIFIFGLFIIINIYIVWVIGFFIGLMYGIFLLVWNIFMVGYINFNE